MHPTEKKSQIMISIELTHAVVHSNTGAYLGEDWGGGVGFDFLFNNIRIFFSVWDLFMEKKLIQCNPTN